MEPRNTFDATYDATELNTFLNFLEPGGERFTGAVFDGERPIAGMGVLCGTVAELQAIFANLFSSYRGQPEFHVTLNRCKDTGRKSRDIESCRVLCVDLDRHIAVEELRRLIDTYKIGMVVQSSPGRYHLYWQLGAGVPLEQWKRYQLALAQHFGGDKSLAQVAHIIRVPGFWRTTKQGERFCPKIVYLCGGSNDCEPLSELSIGELFPWVEAEYQAAKAERRSSRNAARGGGVGRVNGHGGAAAEGRNSILYDTVFQECLVRLGSGEFSEEDAVAFGLDFNTIEFSAHVQGPLETREVEATSTSAYRGACEARDRDAAAAAEKEEAIKAKLLKLGNFNVGKADIKTKESLSQPENKNSEGIAAGTQTTGTAAGMVPTVFAYDFSAPGFAAGRYDDKALCERVVQKYGDRLVRIANHVDAFDIEEKVWRRQGQGEYIAEFVSDCVEDMIREGEFYAQFRDSKGQYSEKMERRAIERLRSNGLVLGTGAVVVKDNRIKRMQLQDFDSRVHWLHCPNGVLDMLTGEMREARAEDYLLCRAGVAFDAGAECPGWLKFLGEIFAENEEPEHMVSFCQQMFGYTLGGSIDAQKIFVHYGGGANGKSKVLYALGLILGTYTARLECGALAKGKGSVQRELNRLGASIEGKRAVVIDDLDVASTWNEGFVKSLTGPYLLSRKLYEEEIQLLNRAKFHLGCNVPPKPEAENLGILRRLCIIPYSRTFEPDGAMESRILRMLHSEAGGILRWAVEGYRAVMGTGELQIEYPEELQAMTKEYRKEHFTVETAVEGLIAVAKEGDTRGRMLTTEELLNRLRPHLPVGMEMTAVVLGRVLSKMGVFQVRTMEDGKRIRKYFVRLNSEL